MSFQTDLEAPNKEKHQLVILKPRTRLLGWTNHSGNIWKASFDKGPVSRVWMNYDETDGFVAAASVGAMVASTYYWDEANSELYVYSTVDPDSAANMESTYEAIPGLTVEYELYMATRAFYGPRNPLDSDSDPVEWQPVLREAPSVSHGSRAQLYGFNPLDESSLAINSQDGWMLPHLHDSSFSYAVIRSYVMIGTDIEFAAEQGLVKEIYRGFSGAPKLSAEGAVQIPCFDFLAFLNRLASPNQRVIDTLIATIDPEATKSGQEYFIRRVRGMVDNLEPVNIDYNASIATNTNRDFIAYEEEGTIAAENLVIDHTASNTNTRTYFTTTPRLNINDAVWFVHAPGPGQTLKYAIVTDVNYASKYIEHIPISRTIASGDLCNRYAIGWIRVQDSDGVWYDLMPFRDFLYANDGSTSTAGTWGGFILQDNFEANISFPETFDPAKHKILCRVYGSRTIDTLSDGSTPNGAVVNEGGCAAQASTLLHYLLRKAGIPNDMIDVTSFSSLSTNHALGVAIPANKSDAVAPTYKELIGQVLQSMMWKLCYVNVDNEMKIGVLETGPFAGAADYEIDDKDLRNFAFEHDYSDIYKRVQLTYWKKEYQGDGTNPYAGTPTGNLVAAAESRTARDLHFSRELFQLDILQYLPADAQVIADRYAIALGDRRAFYSVTLGTAYIDRDALGTSYQVKRSQLPGFELDLDIERERQTAVIESTKSDLGVTLTLEDQKGIEDNSGDW